MTVTHPQTDRDASPAAVTVGSTTYSVGNDGVVDCPADEEAHVADVLADVYGVGVADILADRCDERTSAGDICGRELPCPYHTDHDEGSGESED